MKILTFDLGGTLMEYTGMPDSWTDYYKQGFEAVDQYYHCNISTSHIEKSVEILCSFNPRIHYREEEYSPEYIFKKALEHWHRDIPIADCADIFYRGLKLKAEIYPDTIPILITLRKQGYQIATLTDLPTAMPDELFKKDIAQLLPYFDLYVSSLSCGFRKPNIRGLQMISRYFGVPITELIFIGDEEKDRKTADNAKCHFIRINRKQKGGGDIEDLHELVELLGRSSKIKWESADIP